MKTDRRARLAGDVLLGERSVAELPPPEQQELLDELIRGRCVLFRADPERPDGPSLSRFPGLSSPATDERLHAERHRCDEQRQAFLAAQALLARVEIPLLLFKSAGPYPYASSNVDALVPAGHLARAVQQLEANGHREMTHYWEPNKRLLRLFHGRDSALELHLHEQVSWIVLSFLDPEAIWTDARSSVDPEIRHPAPEHMVAALLAHSVYESNRVTLGDVEKIHTALAEPGFDWPEVRRCAAARAWLPGLALSRYWHAAAERALFGHARLDEPGCVEGLPPLWSGSKRAVDAAAAAGTLPLRLRKARLKTYYFRKLLVDSRRSWLQKLWDLAGVTSQIVPGRLGLRARPASFVCLVGIDGSGKSSHVDALCAALDECEIPRARVWMRGGYAPLSEALKRVLRRSSARVPRAGDDAGKARLYRAGGLRWLWALWVAIEQTVQALVRVRLARWLGRTVIAERYLPDTLVDLSQRFADPDFARRGPARWMQRASPSPDLILLLDLPGDVAFARKSDDWSPAVLEHRRALYRQVLAEHPRVVVLDAQRPQAGLEHEIVDRVLQLVLRRIAEGNRLAQQRRDAWE